MDVGTEHKKQSTKTAALLSVRIGFVAAAVVGYLLAAPLTKDRKSMARW